MTASPLPENQPPADVMAAQLTSPGLTVVVLDPRRVVVTDVATFTSSTSMATVVGAAGEEQFSLAGYLRYIFQRERDVARMAATASAVTPASSDAVTDGSSTGTTPSQATAAEDDALTSTMSIGSLTSFNASLDDARLVERRDANLVLLLAAAVPTEVYKDARTLPRGRLKYDGAGLITTQSGLDVLVAQVHQGRRHDPQARRPRAVLQHHRRVLGLRHRQRRCRDRPRSVQTACQTSRI